MRMMYLHAWQSYLWNVAASERIKLYGCASVVAGDLVLRQSERDGVSPAADGDVARTATAEPCVDVDGGIAADALDCEDAELAEMCDALEQVTPQAAENNSSAQDKPNQKAQANGSSSTAEPAGSAAGDPNTGGSTALTGAAARLAAIHEVTQAEAAAGVFSVSDVVLPLPGYQVQYPNHAAGWELYNTLAGEHGISLNGAPCHNVKDFSLASLTGDYRRLLHVPSDLTARVIRYSNPDDDSLAATDWDLLQQQQQQQEGSTGGSEVGNAKGPVQEDTQTADFSLQQPRDGLQGQTGALIASALQQPSSAAKTVPCTAAGDGTAGCRNISQPDLRSDRAIASSNNNSTAMLPGDGERFMGLELRFNLQSSCYATMLVRELTKSSTSKASHKQLSEDVQDRMLLGASKH